jgi:hypothetical protein
MLFEVLSILGFTIVLRSVPGTLGLTIRMSAPSADPTVREVLAEGAEQWCRQTMEMVEDSCRCRWRREGESIVVEAAGPDRHTLIEHASSLSECLQIAAIAHSDRQLVAAAH